MDFVANALKYAEDMTNVVDCLLAQNRKKVNLVNIISDQINYNDTTTNKTVIITRIVIADGYRSYAPPDGYLNPRVELAKSVGILVSSNGQLTDNMFVVGSLVFPYTLNGFSGGLDPIVFQPASERASNIQTYLQIFGLGLSPTGNFFQIKEILLSGKGIQEGISYKLLIEATSTNPLL
jgi:hypothetical protein